MFIVEASEGDWDDHSYWIVGFFDDESEAKQVTEDMNAESKTALESITEYYDFEDIDVDLEKYAYYRIPNKWISREDYNRCKKYLLFNGASYRELETNKILKRF